MSHVQKIRKLDNKELIGCVQVDHVPTPSKIIKFKKATLGHVSTYVSISSPLAKILRIVNAYLVFHSTYPNLELSCYCWFTQSGMEYRAVFQSRSRGGLLEHIC